MSSHNLISFHKQFHARGRYTHGTGTEIRYQDPSALPWSKMATAATGKDVNTAITPEQWWLDLV